MNRPEAISGIVDAVFTKTINNGKLKIGVCISDTWYNLLCREQLVGVVKGAQVAFTATDRGGKIGWCIHPDTLHVTRESDVFGGSPDVCREDAPPWA